MITERITVPSHLWGPRTQPVRIVIIHATRGGTSSAGWEYIATKNWFQSPNNPGSMASRIIGPNGEHCIALDDSQVPHWSAGYGSIGYPTEFLIDAYAISYEVAQPNDNYPFTEAQYIRLAQEVAKDCKTHNIPPLMLDLRPVQRFPVPAGITRHDRTANGTKLGKSDPGKMFDEAKFMALLKANLGEEDWFDMATKQELREVLEELIGTKDILNGRTVAQFLQESDDYIINTLLAEHGKRADAGVFIKPADSGAVYLLTWRVIWSTPSKITYSLHHVANPTTLELMGGRSGVNYVEVSPAVFAHIKTVARQGEPTPSLTP